MPNSATLLQALGAAFCAILCALSGMGGGGMMLGARTAAWAKSGYTAKDYVQDGLIAMWDGIENAGWGQHDPNATVWKNLVSDQYDFNLPPIISFTNDSAVFRSGIGRTQLWAIPMQSINTEEFVGKSDQVSYMAFQFDNQELNSKENGRLFCILPTNNRGFSFESNSPSMFRDWYTKRWSVSATWGEQFKTYYGAKPAETNAGTSSWSNGSRFASIGHTSGSYPYIGEICCARLYSRSLTDSEIAANYAIDKARFNLPDAA